MGRVFCPGGSHRRKTLDRAQIRGHCGVANLFTGALRLRALGLYQTPSLGTAKEADNNSIPVTFPECFLESKILTELTSISLWRRQAWHIVRPWTGVSVSHQGGRNSRSQAPGGQRQLWGALEALRQRRKWWHPGPEEQQASVQNDGASFSLLAEEVGGLQCRRSLNQRSGLVRCVF